jgi:hypothetical protein
MAVRTLVKRLVNFCFFLSFAFQSGRDIPDMLRGVTSDPPEVPDGGVDIRQVIGQRRFLAFGDVLGTTVRKHWPTLQ